MKTREVCYWHGCINRADFPEQAQRIDRLLNGELDIEKMVNLPIYKVRINHADRFVWTTKVIDGKPHMYVLGTVDNHDYQKFKYLKKTVLRDHLYHNTALSFSEPNAAMEPLDSTPFVQVDYNKHASYFNDQFIVLDESLIISAPVLIVGPAGSGKSGRLFDSLHQMLDNLPDDDERYIVYVAKSEPLVTQLALMWGTRTAGDHKSSRVLFKHYDALFDYPGSPYSPEKKVGKCEFFTWFDGYIAHEQTRVDKNRSGADWFDDYIARENHKGRSNQNTLKAAKASKLKQEGMKGVWTAVKQLRHKWAKESVYQEFKAISVYASEQDVYTSSAYLALGQKQSLFCKKGAYDYKPQLLNAYKAYARHCIDSRTWDPALCPLDSPLSVYGAAIDEVFDLSSIEMYSLLKLTPNLYCAGDSHQRQVRRSYLPTMMNMLQRFSPGRTVSVVSLPASYRCPVSVIELTNRVIGFKNIVTGGRADSYETLTISIPTDTEKEMGRVIWFQPELDEDAALCEVLLSTDYVVVTLEEHLDKARLRYKTKLIFTPEQFKGMESLNVIAYRLLDDANGLCDDASARYEDMPPEQRHVHENQAVKGQDHDEYVPPLNDFIIAITRTMHTLYVVQDRRKNIKTMLSVIEGEGALKKPALPISLSHQTSNTEEDWINQLNYLIMKGADEQAKAIFVDLFVNERHGQIEADFFSYRKKIIQPASARFHSMQNDCMDASDVAVQSLSVTVDSSAPLKVKQNHVKKQGAVAHSSSEAAGHQNLNCQQIDAKTSVPEKSEPRIISPTSVSVIGSHENTGLPDVIQAGAVSSAVRADVVSLKKTESLNHLKIEASIKRLLANFNEENLTLWFKWPKGMSYLTYTLSETGKPDISILSTILMSPEYTSIFCQFLKKQESATTPSDLIRKIDRQLIAPNGFGALHVAAYFNNVAFIELFHAYGADPNRPDVHCQSPLYVAITRGSINAINTLIALGAKLEHILNGDIYFDEMPNIVPFFVGMDYGSLEVMHQLGLQRMAVGETIVKRGVPHIEGASALFSAAQNGHVSQLKVALNEPGVNINQAFGPTGVTALIIAVQHGLIDIVHELIFAGVDVNQSTQEGATPLLLATQFGYLDIIQALIYASADVNLATPDGCTPLMSAVRFSRFMIVDCLIKAGADTACRLISSNRNAMDIAKYYNHTKIVECLVMEDAACTDTLMLIGLFTAEQLRKFCAKANNINLLSRRLPYICKTNDSLLWRILNDSKFKPIFCNFLRTDPMGIDLIEKIGANSDWVDGSTAAHVAVAANCVELIYLLAAHNINIDVPNKKGVRPLVEAIKANYLVVAKALVQAGARVTYNVDYNYLTPLNLAVKYNNDKRSHLGLICFLIKSGAHLTINTGHARALSVAAMKGDHECVKLLLDYGADINYLDPTYYDGASPLYIASKSGHLEMVKLLLMNKQINIDQASSSGMTALMGAAQGGHKAIVEVLIHAGANLVAVTPTGETARFIAGCERQWVILDMLDKAMQKLNVSHETHQSEPVGVTADIQNAASAMISLSAFRDVEFSSQVLITDEKPMASWALVNYGIYKPLRVENNVVDPTSPDFNCMTK